MGFVPTVVSFSARDEVSQVLVFGDINTFSPAFLVIFTLMSAIIEFAMAPRALQAVLSLIVAILLDAVSGVSEDLSKHFQFVKAIILQDAVPKIDSRLVALPSEAWSVARDSLSAFVAAIVKSILALRVEAASD